MRFEEAKALVIELADCAGLLDDAVRQVIAEGASTVEIEECQEAVAAVSTALFLDAAGPLIRTYPTLEAHFTGAGQEGRRG